MQVHRTATIINENLNQTSQVHLTAGIISQNSRQHLSFMQTYLLRFPTAVKQADV